MRTVAVVLAGGTGTRLYPASRPDCPKQFRSFDGGPSLLSRAVERAAVADETVVLTRPALAERAAEHAPDAQILTEPAAKDTGPALAYAAHELRDADALLCLPSDHYVAGPFERVARDGLRVAHETGALVTFGVEPTRPATGYGYVRPGPERTLDGATYHPVERFTEKPDPETADRYCEQGSLWNAGLFAWRPDAFLAAARDSPLAPLVDRLDDGAPAAGFAAVDPISVDYAVLERTDDAVVVPAPIEWDDLGAWDALARVLDADADGNVAL
ncbi:MAG: mannose-1-phosphate guanylyltransferase, partial [Haloarculaceae archaeon]